MATKNNYFFKLWAMPICLAVVTFIGLISAIMGTGMWHIFSWIALSIPLYVMTKYGMGYFKKIA